MTVDEAKRLAKKQLSPKRYRHTKNVAAAAHCLALLWDQDPEKAELAGWLHDIVKECTPEQLLQLMEQDDIISGLTKQRPIPIWHGPCGAIYAKTRLGVTDEAILSAICCHTTGKEGMSLFDKVLFLADATSEERDFDGVDEMRALAERDIDRAVIAAMEENVRYLVGKGKPLDVQTDLALKALKGKNHP